MEVVSHLLFEACRKIIAQLQAAVAESMGGGGGIAKRKRRVVSESAKCRWITCACLANGR